MIGVANFGRALALTAAAAGASVVLGECSKRAIWADVEFNRGGTEVQASILGAPVLAVTNPDTISLVTDRDRRWDLLQDKAQEAMWALKGVKTHDIAACRQYRTYLDGILKDPHTTDGMKEIHIRVSGQMAGSVIKERGRPEVAYVAERISDEAREVIRDRRTAGDYQPWSFGFVALSGFAFVFLSLSLRERLKEIDEESTLPTWGPRIGVTVAFAAGLIAVRAADGHRRVHVLPDRDTCGEIFKP